MNSVHPKVLEIQQNELLIVAIVDLVDASAQYHIPRRQHTRVTNVLKHFELVHLNAEFGKLESVFVKHASPESLQVTTPEVCEMFVVVVEAIHYKDIFTLSTPTVVLTRHRFQ